MLTRTFWLDALERALKTGAQTVLIALGATSISIMATNWLGALELGAGAAVISVLSSVTSASVGAQTASLVRQVQYKLAGR